MPIPAVKTGPSWQWLTNVLLGVLISIMGVFIGWIALTTYDLGLQVSKLGTKLYDIGDQLTIINTRLDTLDTRFTLLDEKTTSLTTQLDNNTIRERATAHESSVNSDWIAAQVFANEAIRRAESAKHPKRIHPQIDPW